MLRYIQLPEISASRERRRGYSIRFGLLAWKVDHLINDAGFGDHGAFFTSDLAKQERMIGVNITICYGNSCGHEKFRWTLNRRAFK